MQINKLNVAFKDKVLFKDFSLSLDNKKVTCILGPSGVGKTTLLNVLVDNVKYSGIVTEKEKFAYVFQNSRLIESISVLKNLEFVLDKKDYVNIDSVLKALEIEDCKYKYPRELSGGQASRVAIARAILYNPQIILMDEPFKDLDFVLSKKTIDLFRNLVKENNIGSIYVTHNIDEALSIADRIIVLNGNPVEVALDVEVISDHNNLASKELNDVRQKIYSALGI